MTLGLPQSTTTVPSSSTNGTTTGGRSVGASAHNYLPLPPEPSAKPKQYGVLPPEFEAAVPEIPLPRRPDATESRS
jgi:hypothetical protein